MIYTYDMYMTYIYTHIICMYIYIYYTGVAMVGVTCAHCRLRFCMKHQLPEVHGCGTDAKASAKAQPHAV
jgi:hypothetical protein